MGTVYFTVVQPKPSEGNGLGPIIADSAEEFAAFDKLPIEVRQIIAEAPHPYSTQDIFRMYRKAAPDGERGLKSFCRLVRYGHEEHVGIEAFCMYGPGHPQADIGRKRKIKVHPNSLLARGHYG